MSRQERNFKRDRSILDLLTPEQYRIVKMTFTGASNQQIAYLMGIGEQAVKNQLTRAYGVTGARNRTHLAVLVWEETEGRFGGRNNASISSRYKRQHLFYSLTHRD
jgi:DNA-binding CsgD family transcriptional regulator